jgi:tRNA dimethylallyltransferase
LLHCLCLTGPTATGKTELALRLAEALPIEIISMDSTLVYRGMDIGTAKPPPAVRGRVPHHLIDILDPAEPYSAGRFVADARAAAAEIGSRGRVPLLVGGTLLYLAALRGGLAKLPRADAAVRRRIDALAADHGWPELHKRLARLDPAAAARIAPTDKQRIQRALEVVELTGEPISALQQRPNADTGVSVRVLALIDEDRAALGRRIETRFDAMIERGLVGEVEALMARGDLHAELPAIRAVGYRQVWAYLSGELGWGDARRRAITATRQLAKRQMTWLRSERGLRRADVSDPGNADAVLRWALQTMETAENTRPAP